MIQYNTNNYKRKYIYDDRIDIRIIFNVSKSFNVSFKRTFTTFYLTCKSKQFLFLILFHTK